MVIPTQNHSPYYSIMYYADKPFQILLYKQRDYHHILYLKATIRYTVIHRLNTQVSTERGNRILKKEEIFQCTCPSMVLEKQLNPVQTTNFDDRDNTVPKHKNNMRAGIRISCLSNTCTLSNRQTQPLKRKSQL